MGKEERHVNSPEVVERLVNENYGLIKFTVSRYPDPIIDFEEAVEHATIGLLNAAKHFDESKGFKFSSFAYQCIWNEVRNYLIKERKYHNRYKSSLVVTDKRSKEVDLFENLEGITDEAGKCPNHQRDPLSLLIEKDRQQQISHLAEEASWLGNEYINTFIDYYYRDDTLSQRQLGETVGLSQAQVSKRLIAVANGKVQTLLNPDEKKWEYINVHKKNKEIRRFKQQLQALR